MSDAEPSLADTHSPPAEPDATSGLPGPVAPIRVWVRQAGHAPLRESVSLDDVRQFLTESGTLTWMDLIAPHPAALATLAEVCQLHPLAIEDARQPHNRPKIDEYAHFYFVVFYVARYDAALSSLTLHEIDMFVSERFLITVHQRPVSQIDDAVRRWATNGPELGHDVGALLYALLDSIVDTYFPVLDIISEHVDSLQEAILQEPDQRALRDLARLRRTLLRLRRVVAPEREVMNTLLRRDHPVLPSGTLVYFYDVYDHIVRVLDTIDSHREVLSSATESYLSMTSNNLNQIMKVLTSWSIILMSSTLIAGIYGMNFVFMPELGWRYGYPLALALMLATGGGLFLFFRRREWL